MERDKKFVNIRLICFDHKNLVNGKINSLHQKGCDFISCSMEDFPPFPFKSRVYLNLFDEDTKKACTCLARLNGYQRHEKKWIYRVRWEKLPEVFTSA